MIDPIPSLQKDSPRIPSRDKESVSRFMAFANLTILKSVIH